MNTICSCKEDKMWWLLLKELIILLPKKKIDHYFKSECVNLLTYCLSIASKQPIILKSSDKGRGILKMTKITWKPSFLNYSFENSIYIILYGSFYAAVWIFEMQCIINLNENGMLLTFISLFFDILQSNQISISSKNGLGSTVWNKISSRI